MSTPPPVLLWFRQDLRLADHAALTAALATGRPVIPVYIFDPESEAAWAPGGASRWWLHRSLEDLAAQLATLGAKLIFRAGESLSVLRALGEETGAREVHWQRRYEPDIIARDTRIKEALRSEGWAVASHAGALLHEPWTVQNKSGKPYQVFTPFWKHCLTLPEPPQPLPRPSEWPFSGKATPWPSSLALSDLGLQPKIPWDAGLQAFWNVGERAAHSRLHAFAEAHFSAYSEDRNRPDLPHTSRLSPYLHHGELTPRQIWHYLAQTYAHQPAWQRSTFVTEVGWREFAHHLLFYFPETPQQPLRKEWLSFPTEMAPSLLQAWQKGQTGYPMVDAGMRELWHTGWMHNRVRMIVGSFLVKDLFLPWQSGADWFWDTLVDADLASNTLGWQWTAGCGADAAPYFRVFNPTTQGEKFDPHGAYIRKYLPELAKLPDSYIHRPHEAPAAILAHAGVVLGKTYSKPVVDHNEARKRALAAYAAQRDNMNPKAASHTGGKFPN